MQINEDRNAKFLHIFAIRLIIASFIINLDIYLIKFFFYLQQNLLVVQVFFSEQ